MIVFLEFFLHVFCWNRSLINFPFTEPDSDSDGSDGYEDCDEDEERAPVLHGRDRARLCPRHKRKVRDFGSAMNSSNYDAIPILRQDIRYV